ncbi:hypothetical protein K438DRAFT_791172 [Mycena galopus ATCC 62051]|nr:hypothetical protein K438DRAFT_791172 [Mycena galopus ATCC 62051]
MSKFERHVLTNHSAWADLELDIVTANSTFHCPAGDFEDAESVEAVRDHALSNCVQAALYRKLKKEAVDALPKTDETRSFREKRQGRSNVANEVNKFQLDPNSKEVVVQETDVKSRLKELIGAAAARSSSVDDAEHVAQVLIDYLDEAPETPLSSPRTRPGPTGRV